MSITRLACALFSRARESARATVTQRLRGTTRARGASGERLERLALREHPPGLALALVLAWRALLAVGALALGTGERPGGGQRRLAGRRRGAVRRVVRGVRRSR